MLPYRYLLLILCWALFFYSPVFADDMDDLLLLGGEEIAPSSEESNDDLDALSGMESLGSDAEDLFETALVDSEDDSAEDSGFSFSVNGYLKAMLNYNRTVYSDELWSQFQQLAGKGQSVPEEQEEEDHSYIGLRGQVTLEAFFADKARLFARFNLDYNLADESDAGDSASNTSQDDSDQEIALRMVEAFLELYNETRTWKIGSQLITWGYMEGYEVPTDIINARDLQYVTSEYEDTKISSTAIVLNQEIGQTQLELIYIPKVKTHLNPAYADDLFAGGERAPDSWHKKDKVAARFIGSLGKLDSALSYTEGMDHQSDNVLEDSNGDQMEYDPSATVSAQATALATYYSAVRTFNQVRSVGLDMQYSFDSWISKVSAMHHRTDDDDGEDPFIKNSWHQYLIGGEFKLGSATVNLYAGQIIVENYQSETLIDTKTNNLNNQRREQTDVISGHIDADFLSGNALKLHLMFAGYWDDEGELDEKKVKTYVKYKIANGLEIYFGVSHSDIEETHSTDYLAEMKYSL